MDAKSLIKLNFYKNADDKYHCPVLFKLFTKHSHIVAIKTTGNVLSYEASIKYKLSIFYFFIILSLEITSYCFV